MTLNYTLFGTTKSLPEYLILQLCDETLTRTNHQNALCVKISDQLAAPT